MWNQAAIKHHITWGLKAYMQTRQNLQIQITFSYVQEPKEGLLSAMQM